jgi:hypothetical protein
MNVHQDCHAPRVSISTDHVNSDWMVGRRTKPNNAPWPVLILQFPINTTIVSDSQDTSFVKQGDKLLSCQAPRSTKSAPEQIDRGVIIIHLSLREKK